ncbi:MAG: hypothetical protein WCO52_01580 [bacterium]
MLRLPRPTLSSSLWLVIPLCLSPLSYAHAYLDPGTGSYVIQVIVGVIFGAAYTMRGLIGRLVTKLRSRKSNKKNDPDA